MYVRKYSLHENVTTTTKTKLKKKKNIFKTTLICQRREDYIYICICKSKYQMKPWLMPCGHRRRDKSLFILILQKQSFFLFIYLIWTLTNMHNMRSLIFFPISQLSILVFFITLNNSFMSCYVFFLFNARIKRWR